MTPIKKGPRQKTKQPREWWVWAALAYPSKEVADASKGSSTEVEMVHVREVLPKPKRKKRKAKR